MPCRASGAARLGNVQDVHPPCRCCWLVGWSLVMRPRSGMRCRMVIFSGPMRTSLTSRRSTRRRRRGWRSRPGCAVGRGSLPGRRPARGRPRGRRAGRRGPGSGCAGWFPGRAGRACGAQLVDGDQLFAERFDHAGDAVAGLGQRGSQPLPLAGGGVAAAGDLQALVDLGADQGGLGRQRGEVVPRPRCRGSRRARARRTDVLDAPSSRTAPPAHARPRPPATGSRSGSREPGAEQFRGRFDPPGVLPSISTTSTYDIKVLLRAVTTYVHRFGDTPRCVPRCARWPAHC